MSVRDDFSRGEAAAGLTWLSIGALISLALEVVYVGGGVGRVLMPVAALLFNAVLTKTAKLWTDSFWVALIPLGVWVLGFFVAMLFVPVFGFAPVPADAMALILLFAGIAGGVWPIFQTK